MNSFLKYLGRAAAAAGLIIIVAGAPDRVAAFGAVATGEPARIADRGVAVGTSRNFASKEEAEAQALKQCRGFMDAPPDTRALCKLRTTFEKKCYAIALDPKAGTPGFGWAVTASEAGAEDAAMDRCRRTAGKSRTKFCKVALNGCDSTNNPSH